MNYPDDFLNVPIEFRRVVAQSRIQSLEQISSELRTQIYQLLDPEQREQFEGTLLNAIQDLQPILQDELRLFGEFPEYQEAVRYFQEDLLDAVSRLKEPTLVEHLATSIKAIFLGKPKPPKPPLI